MTRGTATSEYGEGGGLASSIVTQEGSDLALVHVQVEVIHCHFPLYLSVHSVETGLGEDVVLQ